MGVTVGIFVGAATKVFSTTEIYVHCTLANKPAVGVIVGVFVGMVSAKKRESVRKLERTTYL